MRFALPSWLGSFPLRLSKAVDAPSKRVRIKRAEVKRLSLCKEGKNGLRTLYKADGTLQLDALVKSIDEGTLLAVMYAPERPDADGHVADSVVVRQMLHTLMRNGAELDIEHDGKVLAKSAAYVAEAFTIQKGDARFADWLGTDGKPAGDLTGAAAVQINIDDPELRASRRRGEWDGISLFGVGEGVPEQLTKSSSQPEDTMTPEQLKALQDSFTATFTAGLASLQTALVKSVTDQVKPPETPAAAPGAPVLATLVAEVAELRKSLLGTAEDQEAGIESTDTAEVRDLKLKLFKAKRKSNAPAAGAPAAEKPQAELDHAEGLELAKSLSGESKPVNGWLVH